MGIVLNIHAEKFLGMMCAFTVFLKIIPDIILPQKTFILLHI